MKNKASLSLLEQLVMILVFALAAALCLGVFARADKWNREITRRETAAQIAQNGVELLKSGAELEELTLPQGYSVQFQPEQEPQPAGLKSGAVEVYFQGELVFSLPGAWQEGKS